MVDAGEDLHRRLTSSDAYTTYSLLALIRNDEEDVLTFGEIVRSIALE